MSDLYYSFPDDTTATLIGCDLDYEGDVIVPSEIEGHTLTAIENNAFRYCSLVTSISLPETITSIGEYAFCECLSLTSINIPNTITSIPIGCFRECKSLVSIDFNNVTEIQEQAFAECSNFNTVIPNTITTVKERAFHHSGLANLHIHVNLTTIGDGAFCWCPLETLTIDENNTNYIIEDDVLYNTAKTEIILYPPFKTDVIFSIPETVTRINRYAFEENYYMEKIRINYNIQILDGLGGLMNIRDFECYNGEEIVSYTKNGFSVTQNKISKKNYLTYRNSALYRVPVDESILVSGNMNRYSIDGLENFPIKGSSNFVYIDTTTLLYYYWNGASYTQFDYSSLSTGISFSACHHGTFSNCVNLTSLPSNCSCYTIPNSSGNSSIGYKCFYKCNNLFENNSGSDTVVVTTYGTENEICEYAFAECLNLTQLVINKSGNSNYPLTVSPYAFYNCSSMENLQISNSYNKNIAIMSHAFENCTSLNNILYVGSLNLITDIMTSEKYGFKSVLNSQNTISCEVFNNVTLGYFGFKIVTPVSDNYTLFKIYQSQPNAVSIILGNGMTKVIASSLTTTLYSGWKFTKLKYLKFPSTIETIGTFAFRNTHLEMANVDFSDCKNIKTIEPESFYGAKNIDIYLNTVSYVGYMAFNGATFNNDINIEINNDENIIFEGSLFYETTVGNITVNGICNTLTIGVKNLTKYEYVTTNNSGYTQSTATYSSYPGNSFAESPITEFNVQCNELIMSGYGNFKDSQIVKLNIQAENQTLSNCSHLCYYCTNLKEVTISGQVFNSDFYECNNLTKIKFYKMSSTASADVISNYSFVSCSKIKELDFTDSGFTNIDLSYNGNTNYNLGRSQLYCLKSLKLPNNLTTLTLSGYGLKGSNVELPNSLTELIIKPPCYALTELKIPKNVKSITFGGYTYSAPNTSDTVFIRRIHVPQGCTVTNGIAYGCFPIKITYY